MPHGLASALLGGVYIVWKNHRRKSPFPVGSHRVDRHCLTGNRIIFGQIYGVVFSVVHQPHNCSRVVDTQINGADHHGPRHLPFHIEGITQDTLIGNRKDQSTAEERGALRPQIPLELRQGGEDDGLHLWRKMLTLGPRDGPDQKLIWSALIHEGVDQGRHAQFRCHGVTDMTTTPKVPGHGPRHQLTNQMIGGALVNPDPVLRGAGEAESPVPGLGLRVGPQCNPRNTTSRADENPACQPGGLTPLHVADLFRGHPPPAEFALVVHITEQFLLNHLL